MSAKLKIATTPGILLASALSMPRIFACAVGAAHEGRLQHLREFDVVDKAALALDQRQVFRTLDRLPEISIAHDGALLRRIGDRQHRIDDALIAGAAAEIAG